MTVFINGTKLAVKIAPEAIGFTTSETLLLNSLVSTKFLFGFCNCNELDVFILELTVILALIEEDKIGELTSTA